MIKAGIIGATGNAGAELVRILMNHKEVEIAWYGSRSYVDENYADIYGNMFQIVDAKCMDDNMEELAESVDVIFTATQKTYKDSGIEVSKEEAKQFEERYRYHQKHIHVPDGIKALLSECKKQGKTMGLLTNGTGRAAKVFSAYAGHPAFTIHKKIYRQQSFSNELSNFSVNDNLTTHTLYIVDEASMISNEELSGSMFGTGRLLDDLVQFVYSGQGTWI